MFKKKKSGANFVTQTYVKELKCKKIQDLRIAKINIQQTNLISLSFQE